MISIIIPVFNEPQDRINEATDMAASLAGVYSPRGEVIVVDDGSDHRVEAQADMVIRLPTNRGVSAALNTGIEHASNAYVAILSCGDVWTYEKKRQVDWTMLNRYEATCSITTDRGRPLACNVGRIYTNNQFHGTSTVFTKRAWEAAGRFDAELRYAEDWDFHVRVHATTGWMLYPHVTGEGNVLPGGLSDRTSDEEKNKCRKRVIEKMKSRGLR